jgi:predicted NBD/HSP70 family sugar kinase
MSELLWGIDLGGTKIEGVVIQKNPEFKIIDRQRLPTEASNGYDHILSQIQKLIDQISKTTGYRPDKLGIGTPGIVDQETHLIKNSNTLGLIGRPMKTDLESLLGIEVNMANDANCFAVAETLLGAVPEVTTNPEVVFGVIMGTGVGSGIVVNGKVINGKHGIAGEWGHNVLDETGDDCYCGKKGCVEMFISGPAIEKYYHKISGSKAIASDIYQYHLDGNSAANETMNRFVHYFGKAVANVINIIDPEVIVFGGGIGKLDLIYTQGREEVKKYIFNYNLKTNFIKPKLGDSAGVIGAALL